jgi:hypothetical protein
MARRRPHRHGCRAGGVSHRRDAVLREVVVLPEYGVDVPRLLVRLTPEEVEPAMVGAVELPQVCPPLVLEDWQPGGTRRCPLRLLVLL